MIGRPYWLRVDIIDDITFYLFISSFPQVIDYNQTLQMLGTFTVATWLGNGLFIRGNNLYIHIH